MDFISKKTLYLFLNYLIWTTNLLVVYFIYAYYKKNSKNLKTKKNPSLSQPIFESAIKSKIDFIESSTPQNSQPVEIDALTTSLTENIANNVKQPPIDLSLYDKVSQLKINIIAKDPTIPRSRDLFNVDQLYSSFSDFSKKRLIVFQNQKSKNQALFYVRSEFELFFEKNLCEQIFENIDLIPEFPACNSFYGQSMIAALTQFIQQRKYDEIYFILSNEEIFIWKKTSLYNKAQSRSVNNIREELS